VLCAAAAFVEVVAQARATDAFDGHDQTMRCQQTRIAAFIVRDAWLALPALAAHSASAPPRRALSFDGDGV
jgi:hypothetical protein